MRALLPAVAAAALAAGEALPPVADDHAPVRVHVDQVGYRPAARKLLIVAGDAPLAADLRLTVRAADTWKPVWSTADHPDRLIPFKGGAKDEESGDHVAQLDLSELRTPGRYAVEIERGGEVQRSYSFAIAAGVHRAAAAALWKAFWYNRADCGKDERHGGPWHHAPDHRGPGQATEAKVYRWGGARWFEPVGTEVIDPTPRDVTGGWWDAGDCSKYLGNTAICHQDLLLASQLAGDAYQDDQFDIAESGNGIADALDEIRYGTGFLLRMADATGAAFGRCYEAGACPPDSDTGPVQLTEATSGATMNRCGALAYAALVWKQRGLDPAWRKQCQDEAVKAWKLLAAKPHPWPKDEKDPSKQAYTGEWFCADYGRSRALAGICLWQLTGDEAYHAEAKALIAGWNRCTPEDAEIWPAIWVYAHAPGADAALVAALKRLVLAGADEVVAQSGPARSYAAGVRGYWWGSNRFVAQHGGLCVLAAELCGDAAGKATYIAAAEEYAHYLFGRNAIGQCFASNLVALGVEHSVTTMFHSWVGKADAGEYGQRFIGEGPGKVGPFPGMIVGGVNGSMKRYDRGLDWRTSPWEFNEGDITYQSPAALLVGYLGFALDPAAPPAAKAAPPAKPAGAPKPRR